MPAKGQRRKQQIIDTAKQMFIENGFQSTHIGQVCEKLDIARGTVYQYFGNKREILYAILDSVTEEVDDIFDQDDLIEFFEKNPSKDVLPEHLYSRFSSCMKAVLAEPIVIKLIYKEIVGIDEEVIARVQKFLDYIVKVISRDIAEIQSRGIYKADSDPEITAVSLIGSVIFLVHEFDRKGKDILSPTVIENLVNSYLYGILGI